VPSRVPAGLRKLLADRDNQIFLSAASAWEIVLKWTAQKLDLPSPPDEFVIKARIGSDIDSLPVGEPEALRAAKLPILHKDPVDRILIAQSIEHGLAIATPDPLIRQYAVRTIWD
jgi:PIN domain nuclease of toxin-antitoxin system